MSFYDVILALHIMAVIGTFGMSLAAPMFVPYVHRAHPEALAAVHDMQYRIETRVVGPGIVLVFLFGAHLATKRHLWGEEWVQVPLAILVVIAVLGVWIVKTLKRMAALARADVSASAGTGTVAPSAEYELLYGRYVVAQSTLALLVLVAIFFMAAKPFA